VRKNIGIKLLLALVGLLGIVFFDTTIPFINAVIQLKINILGFFLEPILQRTFDVSLRQAQIISAWIYLLIASVIFWYLLIRIYQAFLASFYAAQQFWLTLNRWQKMGLFFLVMLLFGVIGKVIFLFIYSSVVSSSI
jgi:hypothetical protein